MILKAYSVYDIKSLTFSAPFFMATVGIALRSFQQACQDPATMFNKNPEDFILNEIGSYDDQLGVLTSCEKPIPLASATEYVRVVN